jgi:hypothetical protein
MTVAKTKEVISKAKPDIIRVVLEPGEPEQTSHRLEPVAMCPQEPSPSPISAVVAVHRDAARHVLKLDQPLSTRVHEQFSDLMALVRLMRTGRR